MASRVGINFKHREELDSAVRAMGGDPNDAANWEASCTFAADGSLVPPEPLHERARLWINASHIYGSTNDGVI